MTETNGNEAGSPWMLEHVREQLRQHTACINAEQYRLGRALVEMVDSQREGTSSYMAVMRQLEPGGTAFSRKDVLRAYTVARRFTEEVCVKYGVRRLALLVDYARRFQQAWAEGDPGPTLILVPCESGDIRQTPFAECSLEEMERAISSKRERPAPQSATRADEYSVHLLKQGLRRRLAEDSRASLQASPHQGRMYVTLKRVCVQEFYALQAALRESLIRFQAEKKRTFPRVPRVPAVAVLCLRQPGKAPAEAPALRAS